MSTSYEVCEVENSKNYKIWPSIEEPPELKLKTLPKHLEYAFLVEGSKLPVFIASNLSMA